MTDDPYQHLLDDSRHREALEQRARERWLEAQLREGARFAGTLTDLAERGVPVTLRTESGGCHQATITGVALDHVVLRGGDGRLRHVALEAVTDVRPEPSVPHGGAAGDRQAPLDRTLAEVLARSAEEHPRVHLRVRGQRDGLSGELVAVGRDVVSVRLDGGRGVTYVRLAAIAEVASLA